MANKIVHIEMPSHNLEVSRQFFSQLFDWSIEETPSVPNYLMWEAGDLGGGFALTDEKINNGVLLYIQVEDIPSKLNAIEAAGGKRLNDEYALPENYGSCAEFIDPHGNKLGLFKPAMKK